MIFARGAAGWLSRLLSRMSFRRKLLLCCAGGLMILALCISGALVRPYFISAIMVGSIKV